MAVYLRQAVTLRVALWAGVALMLVTPLIAMTFIEGVSWTGFDFAAAAVILVGAGLGLELAVANFSRPAIRAAVGLGIIAIAALIWADGAVGVFN